MGNECNEVREWTMSEELNNVIKQNLKTIETLNRCITQLTGEQSGSDTEPVIGCHYDAVNVVSGTSYTINRLSDRLTDMLR